MNPVLLAKGTQSQVLSLKYYMDSQNDGLHDGCSVERTADGML